MTNCTATFDPLRLLTFKKHWMLLSVYDNKYWYFNAISMFSYLVLSHVVNVALMLQFAGRWTTIQSFYQQGNILKDGQVSDRNCTKLVRQTRTRFIGFCTVPRCCLLSRKSSVPVASVRDCNRYSCRLVQHMGNQKYHRIVTFCWDGLYKTLDLSLWH